MSQAVDFIEPPRLHWHGLRPFALARLPQAYAHRVEAAVLRLEPVILALPVAPRWEDKAAENPTGSRYASYNAFRLDPELAPLLHAMSRLHRFFLQAIGAPSEPYEVRCWCNVHRAGQRLFRHSHHAQFIGTFSAHAEGSTTFYGPSPAADARDMALGHVDGQLMMTPGRRHFHEVSVWEDAERARVTLSFDIVPARERPEHEADTFVRLVSAPDHEGAAEAP